MAALGVVPASRVAMDTSSLLIAFGPLPTFKAPAPKLIISDEFNSKIVISLDCEQSQAFSISQVEARRCQREQVGGSTRLQKFLLDCSHS